ncbi:MAG: hypothetical protein LPK14_03675 [Hymenobacteraceae bacterium]|nr:hypothetical protein [Hymenobacteraceae bacterium]MDX5421328.1 hypothetical protein [Hymenobacteraceae bacterium]
MSEKDKDKGQTDGRKPGKPDRSQYSQPMPDDYSNEANYRGATDLGTEGTAPTASQQQGQGAWNKKNDDDKRSGTKSGGGGGGQGAKNKTGESD